MEWIFKYEMDTKLRRKIICKLTKDVMEVYRYHGYVSVINAIMLVETDIQQGREYVKRKGHPYLFDPPYILQSDVPIFLSTPRQLTKQVTQVKGLTAYERLITLLDFFSQIKKYFKKLMVNLIGI